MPDLKSADSQSASMGSWKQDLFARFAQGFQSLLLRSAESEGGVFFSSRQQIADEVLKYNSTIERLVDGIPELATDVEVLCRHYRCPSTQQLLQYVSALTKSLLDSLPAHWQDSVSSSPQGIGHITLALIKRPVLTATEYALFNSMTQGFENLARLFDDRNPEYFHYEVIRDLRLTLSWVQGIMANLAALESDPLIGERAFELFGETGRVLEMFIFRKLNLAVTFRKNQDGFQDANRSSQILFERLLSDLEKTVGPSAVPLLKHARSVFSCEHWSGVTLLDLIIKRLILMRPDLRDPLKTRFVEWKNSIFEMQNRQFKIRELLSARSGEIVITYDIAEEILVSIGIYTDLMGALELTHDLIGLVRHSNFSGRFLAQLLRFFLTTLLPGIQKYECFGQGEYNNAERSIQLKTLSLTHGLQRMLKMGEKNLNLLSLTLFRGMVFTYHRQLLIVIGEKTRDYLKASEKETLSDGAATPGRYYLFEKRPLATASSSASPLVPVAKAWSPFLTQFSLEIDQILPLVLSSDSEILQPLAELLHLTASA